MSKENDADDDDRIKTAAQCIECDAVYSAWIFPDDAVQPIGRKDGCRCGCSEFEALSE
jgi:hypothetical protein